VHARSAGVTAALSGEDAASGSGFTSKKDKRPDGPDVFFGGEDVFLVNRLT